LSYQVSIRGSLREQLLDHRDGEMRHLIAADELTALVVAGSSL
jgi:hypothetical protein